MISSPKRAATATSGTRGGLPLIRKLQRDSDELLQFDTAAFQGLTLEEIAELRREVHHRCKVSNGVRWRRDVNAARGMGDFVGAKRTHTEGSELVLHSKPADLKHISTPRIEPDASVQKRYGDQFITPGPSSYNPQLVPSRINNRFIAFLPSSPPKRLQAELDTVAPSAQSYSPHKPLGSEAPAVRIKARRVFCTGGSEEVDMNKFAGPTTYVPPLSDVERKMPNGATAARFYISRSMSHHAPGPLDTAAEGTTPWIWHDARDKRWRFVGKADALLDYAPPESVVGTLREKRAATARAATRRNKSADDNNGAGDAAAGDSARGRDNATAAVAASPRAAEISHLHHPALLLLNALHKRGLQLVRFAVNGSSVHLASKFSVSSGGFDLKPGLGVKDAAILDAGKYVKVELDDDENANTAVDAEQPKQQLEKRHRAAVFKAVEKGADDLMAANSDFVQRCKGRDFTYVSWLDKVLRSQLRPGELPVRLEQSQSSGITYAVTGSGRRITAPPIK